MFFNPCNYTVEELSLNLQLEVIGRHWKYMLREKYQEKQLKEFLNSDFRMMNIFKVNDITDWEHYLTFGEWTFLKRKHIKCHYRSALTGEYLEYILTIGNTNFEYWLSKIYPPKQDSTLLISRLGFKKLYFITITWII